MDDIVKRPRQKRSRDTLEQLMNAGVELLMQGEESEFSVARLSVKSGVSIGSIYQRFGSKEMIYLALQARVLEAMDAQAMRLFPTHRLDNMDDAAVIRDAVMRFCKHVSDHEKTIVALARLDGGNPRAVERGAQSCMKMGKAFETYLQTALGDTRQDAYDRCFRMMFSCTWVRIVGAPIAFDVTTADWTAFCDFLGDMCVAYLLQADADFKGRS
ncbi:TetR/AcrR family transcriptional regulator [Allorhizobium taibaishanense]|nr:TetR/AcrR family transcriptional regulator [Allorhizobium taibaishanense]